MHVVEFSFLHTTKEEYIFWQLNNNKSVGINKKLETEPQD
jgi:hypothetical protein